MLYCVSVYNINILILILVLNQVTNNRGLVRLAGYEYYRLPLCVITTIIITIHQNTSPLLSITHTVTSQYIPTITSLITSITTSPHIAIMIITDILAQASARGKLLKRYCTLIVFHPCKGRRPFMDAFALRPVPRTYLIFKQLLFNRAFSYRALGLARCLALVTICCSRLELLRPSGFRALVTASKSCWAVFELSHEILKIECSAPGSFTRPERR